MVFGGEPARAGSHYEKTVARPRVNRCFRAFSNHGPSTIFLGFPNPLT